MRESDGIKVAASAAYWDRNMTWIKSFFLICLTTFSCGIQKSNQANEQNVSIFLYVEYILVAMFCLAELFFALGLVAKSWKVRKTCDVVSLLHKGTENDKNKQFLRGPQCTLSRCVYSGVLQLSVRSLARLLIHREHTVNLCVAAYQNSLKKHKFRSNVKTTKKRFPKTNKQRCAL